MTDALAHACIPDDQMHLNTHLFQIHSLGMTNILFSLNDKQNENVYLTDFKPLSYLES